MPVFLNFSSLNVSHSIGTNPILGDSDNDGHLDSWEYNNGFDPLDPSVGPIQYFASILGWLGLGVTVTMGSVTVLWILRKYTSSDRYDAYPYDGTSSRR